MLSNIKTYLLYLTILTTMGLAGYAKYQANRLGKADEEISLLNNNYQSLYGSSMESNRVLHVKIDELTASNDSISKQLAKAIKKLNLAKKDISAAIGTTTISNDTIVGIIPIDSIDHATCNFRTTLTFNELTSIEVVKEDSTLYAIPDIRDAVSIIITDKKEYRNKRKNFMDRLFHWDFKRDKIQRVHVTNENSFVKISDVRANWVDK